MIFTDSSSVKGEWEQFGGGQSGGEKESEGQNGESEKSSENYCGAEVELSKGGIGSRSVPKGRGKGHGRYEGWV